MKILSQFQNMAQALSQRTKIPIAVELKNGRILNAVYDPLFKTVTIGGATFPETELNIMTKLCWGSTVAKAVSRTAPVIVQADN
jgi:hypothetical protein